MLHVRRKHPSFGWGKLLWIDNDVEPVGSWIRYHGEDKVLVVSNTSCKPQDVSIPIPPNFQSPSNKAVSVS
jgi:hypothetical protein